MSDFDETEVENHRAIESKRVGNYRKKLIEGGAKNISLIIEKQLAQRLEKVKKKNMVTNKEVLEMGIAFLEGKRSH
jgi:hypothetical protein